MSEAEVNFLVKLRDAHRMAETAIDDYLETKAPKNLRASDASIDLTQIIQKDGVGKKGAFRIAEYTANKDNITFQLLTQRLGQHKGQFYMNGLFIWLFNDGSGNVGMKAVQKGQF